jgi:hypothetical protein
MGSRYGGIKQIDPVGPSGEAIMDYSVYDALRAGFGKVVFVIRKQIEQEFRQAVGSRFERHLPVEYVFQELDKIPAGFTVPPGRTKPWGTLHAILMAADTIHEPFAVINADDFYGQQSYRALAGHLQSGTTESAMVGFILRNTLSDFGTVSRGVCQVSNDGYLQSVVELKSIARDGDHAKNTDEQGHVTELSGDELISMNMWGFNSQIFSQLGEYFEHFLEHNIADLKSECYLPSTVNELVLAGKSKVRMLRTDSPWFGVTYREDRQQVVDSIARLVASGDYPASLWG